MVLQRDGCRHYERVRNLCTKPKAQFGWTSPFGLPKCRCMSVFLKTLGKSKLSPDAQVSKDFKDLG